MAFGYDYVTLNDEQKHARRELLQYYPAVAQWSVLVVFAGFQLYFFLSWLRPSSFHKRLEGQSSLLKRSRQGWDRIMWWMKKDVFSDWGTRAEWIGGTVWTLWLVYLSMVNTGNDYLHLTKRLGIIGASQLPLHFLIAVRVPYSPLQLATRLSHEQLKAPHNILGRIIFLLFTLHSILYLNFFIQSGLLGKRIKDRDVICGIVSIALFATISTTALGRLRRWNYRIFFVYHVVIANILVIPLYLHVKHVRIFVWEVVFVNALHLAFQEQRRKTYLGTIKLLPGTNLVQMCIPLTDIHSALSWQPGQHVYLSLPTGSLYSSSIKDQFALRLRTNPFTVASIPAKDKKLLLVARTLNGNTKQLASLARSLSSNGQLSSIPLAIEGPYGASNRLPDFSTFDKVLFVGGGVGATFLIPIWRSINHPGIRFIWAVQKLADARWAFPIAIEEENAASDSEAGSESHNTNVVEIFVTRDSGSTLHTSEQEDGIELEEADQLLSPEEETNESLEGMVVTMGRPRISAIVDEEFSKGTRVAVVGCGPKRLTKNLSESVEQWVKQGHEVFYHEETFSW